MIGFAVNCLRGIGLSLALVSSVHAAELSEANPADIEIRILKAVPKGITAAFFTKDSRVLYYATPVNTCNLGAGVCPSQIVRVSLMGTELTPTTIWVTRSRVQGLTISEDGSKLIYCSRDRGLTGFFHVDVPARRAVQIPVNSVHCMPTLAFVAPNEVGILPAQTSTPQRGVTFEGWPATVGHLDFGGTLNLDTLRIRPLNQNDFRIIHSALGGITQTKSFIYLRDQYELGVPSEASYRSGIFVGTGTFENALNYLRARPGLPVETVRQILSEHVSESALLIDRFDWMSRSPDMKWMVAGYYTRDGGVIAGLGAKTPVTLPKVVVRMDWRSQLGLESQRTFAAFLSRYSLIAHVYGAKTNPINGAPIGPDRRKLKGIALLTPTPGNDQTFILTPLSTVFPMVPGDVVTEIQFPANGDFRPRANGSIDGPGVSYEIHGMFGVINSR